MPSHHVHWNAGILQELVEAVFQGASKNDGLINAHWKRTQNVSGPNFGLDQGQTRLLQALSL